MSEALRKIKKRLRGIGPIPRQVIGMGTALSCMVLILAVLLYYRAVSAHDRTVATTLLDSGVWVFAESIIGGLLMQSYAEKHQKD